MKHKRAEQSSWRKALATSLACVLLCSCSTLSFSRKDAVFDGSYHALSSLVCSGYWSDRNAQREPLNRSFPTRAGITLGLFAYSVVDVSFSAVGDIIALVPNAVIRAGPARAAFDVQDHEKSWQCGSLQHSIHTMGAL